MNNYLVLNNSSSFRLKKTRKKRYIITKLIKIRKFYSGYQKHQ